MPESLQNKLQQFDVAPPSSVWDKIAAQLDQEFVPADLQLAEKIDNISIPPPQAVWENIAEEIQLAQPDATPQERTKVIPLVYRRIAVAVLVTGILAVAAMYLYTGRRDTNQRDQYATTPKKQEVIVPHTQPGLSDSGQGKDVIKNNPSKEPANPKLQIASIQRKRFVPVGDRPRPIAAPEDDIAFIPADEYADNDFIPQPEEAPLYELHTVSALQPVSIYAPALRDKKGDIILDLATIRKPNDPYIVVTGPNGKQTRISSKFLSCIGYINSGSSDNDAKGTRCTTKFDQWRERLIAEPGFIPTANNFFDIFELKDMVQDM